MEKVEEESRGMSEMRCEKKHTSIPRSPHSSICLFVISQASLVRESENMVRDTTTRLERAAGELEDLIVRATPSPRVILLMWATSEIR